LKTKRLTCFGLVALLIFCASRANAFLVLMTHPSVRSQGFGNAGVALVDGSSYTVNPASLALYGRDGTVSLSFYPIRAKKPNWGDAGFRLYGAAVGLGPNQLGTSSPISFGAAYHYFKLSYGTFVRTSEIGPEPLGTYEPFDLSHNLVISAAYHGRIEIGLGITNRLFLSKLVDVGAGAESGYSKETGYMFDLGLLVRTNFRFTYTGVESKHWPSWSFTPAVGISLLNIGPELNYIDPVQTDPPPRTMRAGLSVQIDRMGNDISYLCFVPIFELEQLLVGDGNTVLHFAGELGLFEIGYFRIGALDDDYSGIDQVAWGFSISTRGVSKLIADSVQSASSSQANQLWQRLTAELSYAKYSEGGHTSWAGLRFVGISISYQL
jgi:hypothetical protein